MEKNIADFIFEHPLVLLLILFSFTILPWAAIIILLIIHFQSISQGLLSSLQNIFWLGVIESIVFIGILPIVSVMMLFIFCKRYKYHLDNYFTQPEEYTASSTQNHEEINERTQRELEKVWAMNQTVEGENHE